MEKHRAVQYFVQEVRANQNSPESELNQLISYRNDAAHGSPQEVLLSESLLELCDFVEALCEAMVELVTYQIIERQKSVGQAKEIGKISEWFRKPKAAVAKLKETTLSVGDNLFLVGESYCQMVKIESIQINDETTNIMQTSLELEVGIKFNVDAKQGLRIYKVSATIK